MANETVYQDVLLSKVGYQSFTLKTVESSDETKYYVTIKLSLKTFEDVEITQSEYTLLKAQL